MNQDQRAQDGRGEAPLPVRDEAVALAATGGDANLAAELLETLLRGLPADLEQLTRCSQENDLPGVANAAHRLRGATSYCGVPALDRVLLELERAAREAKVDDVRLGIRLVEYEAERLRILSAETN